MEMQVDFTGIEDTIKALNALPGLLATQVYGDGMLAAAKVVAADAKQTAAFSDKTGALRKSIRARKQSSTVHTSRGRRKVAGSAAQVVAGGKGANQAFIIEYGRAAGPGYPGAAPRPYLEPALVNTASRQLAAAGAVMKRSFATLAVQITSHRKIEKFTIGRGKRKGQTGFRGISQSRLLRLAAEDT